MRSRVFLEAAVVGIVTALAMALKSMLVTESTWTMAALANFCVGVIIHLGFEVAGGNAWYCMHGAACT